MSDRKPFIPTTSASRVALYMLCPVAAVLPHVKNTRPKQMAGIALHEHMQMRSKLGVDAAMAALPDVCRKHDLTETDAGFLMSRMSKFEWSPPTGSISEVFLCLRKNGDVERLEQPDGRYPKVPPDARLTATVDVIWCEIDGKPVAFDRTEENAPRCPRGAILWVCDYKGGKAVEDVESNRQLEACALLAGKWLKATHVVPAVIYPGKGKGEWDVPSRPLTSKDAADIDARLEKMDRSISAQRRRIADGEPLNPVEGPHCLYCNAQSVCPAKTAMIKGVLGNPLPKGGAAPLTTDELSRLAEILPQLEAFTERGKKALRAHVEATGEKVHLSDGRVWGPNPHKETRILPNIAAEVVAAEFGEKAVETVVVQTVSRKGIEEAAKEFLASQGKARGVAPLVRMIFAKLGAAGGLLSETSTWWSAHKEGAELPEAKTADEEIEDL